MPISAWSGRDSIQGPRSPGEASRSGMSWHATTSTENVEPSGIAGDSRERPLHLFRACFGSAGETSASSRSTPVQQLLGGVTRSGDPPSRAAARRKAQAHRAPTGRGSLPIDTAKQHDQSDESAGQATVPKSTGCRPAGRPIPVIFKPGSPIVTASSVRHNVRPVISRLTANHASG